LRQEPGRDTAPGFCLTPAIACVGSGRGDYKEQASESGAAAYESLHFPVISLLFPVPDPAISADVLVYTHFFADFGCRPAPFTGIYRKAGLVRHIGVHELRPRTLTLSP